jgi:hypothetical protein
MQSSPAPQHFLPPRSKYSPQHPVLKHPRSTSVYPKVSGLAAWSENCKWQSSLSLGAVVSLFCVSVYFVIGSVRKLLDTPSCAPPLV